MPKSSLIANSVTDNSDKEDYVSDEDYYENNPMAEC